MIRKTDALLAAAGLILLAVAAERIGWAAVIRAIEEARIAVAVILGLSLVRLILQTHSWSIALRSEDPVPNQEIGLIAVHLCEALTRQLESDRLFDLSVNDLVGLPIALD